jgi:glycosyltransferase involved in cell wall biosynthesis
MKINFIIPGLFKSGGMKILFEYGNRFTSKGHNVVFYYPFVPYNMLNRKFDIDYFYKRYKEKFSYFLKKRQRLENFYSYNFRIQLVPYINNIFIRDADATIATVWPTAYSVSKLKKSKGKKYYFIQGYETWNSDLNSVNNTYILNLKRITISNYLKNLFLEKFNSDSELILNGIDFNHFNNENKIFNNNKNIAFIYNSLEKKNITLAIESIKVIKKIHPNTVFTCFGHDKCHDLPEFVNFIKNPSDDVIKQIYCNSDIFLFTSKEEGFGLPPAEAMACKCAVVSTKVGAVSEFSKHNYSALHIDPENTKQFIDAILYLLDDEEALKRISLEAYKDVRRNLSWDVSIEKFEKLLLKQ